MTLWALLPLKDLVKAKSRLSGLLAPHERRALVQAMVEDVLVTLTQCAGIDNILLVSDDPAAELLALKYSIATVREEALGCAGLNGAIEAATDYLTLRGATDVMVLHGDVPLLSQTDIGVVLEHYNAAETDVVMGPDLAGTGTNLMVFPVEHRPEFSYGQGSFQAHYGWMQAAGLRVAQVRRRGIGLDVDNPEDLLSLYHSVSEHKPVSHTACLLHSSDISQRLLLVEGSGLGEKKESECYDAV